MKFEIVNHNDELSVQNSQDSKDFSKINFEGKYRF